MRQKKGRWIEDANGITHRRFYNRIAGFDLTEEKVETKVTKNPTYRNAVTTENRHKK